MKNIKYKEYIKKTSIYSIMITISTLKLKELFGQINSFDLFDLFNQKADYLKLILVFFHLISVPLSFAGNKIFKILTMTLHFSAVIANNLDWSKEDFLYEIKSLDIEFFKKYFFEIGFLLNIFIFFDSIENLDNKKNKGNKGEEDKKNKNKDEKNEKRRNQKRGKNYISNDYNDKKGEKDNSQKKESEKIKDDEKEKFNNEEEIKKLKIEIYKKEE
jgi:hypothetical protein